MPSFSKIKKQIGKLLSSKTMLMAEKLNDMEQLRKRLLNWHYKKSAGAGIIELLESDYQRFRNMVKRRVERDIDFREAIKLATKEELWLLQQVRDEKRLGI